MPKQGFPPSIRKGVITGPKQHLQGGKNALGRRLVRLGHHEARIYLNPGSSNPKPWELLKQVKHHTRRSRISKPHLPNVPPPSQTGTRQLRHCLALLGQCIDQSKLQPLPLHPDATIRSGHRGPARPLHRSPWPTWAEPETVHRRPISTKTISAAMPSGPRYSLPEETYCPPRSDPSTRRRAATTGRPSSRQGHRTPPRQEHRPPRAPRQQPTKAICPAVTFLGHARLRLVPSGGGAASAGGWRGAWRPGECSTCVARG